MCLLVFAWQVDGPDGLTVAANRDERLDRAASPFGVLRPEDPKIVGGRDDVGGGTWLAVNEHGVVAGLTNRPSPGGRDPDKSSRGALPLIAAGGRTASDGVEALVRTIRTDRYNPALMLVGDRHSLFSVEVDPGHPVAVRPLGPGLHILENVPLGLPSPKVDRVRWLARAAADDGIPLWDALPAILADHRIPPVPGPDDPARTPTDAVERPAATRAACVHTDGYGTRSSTLVRVPTAPGGRPEVWVAEGSPCTTRFVDVSDRRGD